MPATLAGAATREDSAVEAESAHDRPFSVALGLQLRRVRHRRGLSLHEVERSSHGEFKASVVGAYERGERAISAARLERMARLYRVPIDQLLPDEPASARTPSDAGRPLTIDLRALEGQGDPESELLHSYLERILRQRRVVDDRALAIRQDDVRVLAALFGTTQDGMCRRLQEMEALAVR